MFHFTVPGQPVPKERARAGRGKHHFTPARTRDYEQRVRLCAQSERPRSWPMVGEYVVVITAYFADARARDIDNVAKSLLDGLNGIAWDDDSQVTTLSISRHIDRVNPRASVWVYRRDEAKPLAEDHARDSEGPKRHTLSRVKTGNSTTSKRATRPRGMRARRPVQC